MIKNVIRFEHKIDDKVYQFICENESTLKDIKECLFQFLKYVGQIEDNIKESVNKVDDSKQCDSEENKCHTQDASSTIP